MTSIKETDTFLETKKPHSPSVKTITLGCRLNTYESEVMREHASSHLSSEEVVIINTCAVTNEAERQSRQAVRRARRDHPDARIIVAGCSAQINPGTYGEMAEVDRVLGNTEKMKAESFLPSIPQKVLVNDIMSVTETSHHLISGFDSRTRAFIEIQNGCDHRCTFCSIPFGRGNNRSVPIAEIVRQVQRLVSEGSREVVFTGVDITGYGTDLPGRPTLGQMTRRVLSQVPDLPRLRLSSLDPSEVDDDIYHLLKTEPRLMPHLHISLQAGDNMILKRMKRRHLREDAIAFCQKVRALRPDVVFGADIIAGFPTETEQMFQNSLKIVDECGLTYLHVFPYSQREGTPAARMPQVSGQEIKDRAARLRALGRAQKKAFFNRQLGQTVSVLVEEEGKGHTDHFAPMTLTGESAKALEKGSVVQAEVVSVQGDKGLVGSLIVESSSMRSVKEQSQKG